MSLPDKAHWTIAALSRHPCPEAEELFATECARQKKHEWTLREWQALLLAFDDSFLTVRDYLSSDAPLSYSQA